MTTKDDAIAELTEIRMLITNCIDLTTLHFEHIEEELDIRLHQARRLVGECRRLVRNYNPAEHDDEEDLQ